MKIKHAQAHMKSAYVYAALSHSTRKHVGCVIVKNDTPIAIGWNGTMPGEDNCCEDANGKTKPEVIHAEDNSLRKLIRSHESAIGATVFVTLAPCLPCSTRLVSAQVSEVYYCEYYPTSQPGIDYLIRNGIKCEQLSIDEQK